MLLEELKEGWFIGHRKQDQQPTALTDEERERIKRLFPDSNVHLKMASGEHVFDKNAHAIYKNLRLSFYKKGDELRVSVGHYRDHDGPGNPKVSPVTHTDHIASEDELERIQRMAK